MNYDERKHIKEELNKKKREELFKIDSMGRQISAGPRSKSGYFGVTRLNDNGSKPWRVRIKNGSKILYMESFSDAKEAARAYDAAVRRLGLTKPINFPKAIN